MTLEEFKALLADSTKGLQARLAEAEGKLEAFGKNDAKAEFETALAEAKKSLKGEFEAEKNAELKAKNAELQGKLDTMMFDGSAEAGTKKEEKLSQAWTKALLSSRSTGQMEAKLAEIKQQFALTDGQNIANNPDGGYLVPKVMSDQILEDTINEFAPLLGLTRRVPMGENLTLNVRTGIPSARRDGEGDTALKGKSQYRQIDMNAKRCSVTVPATWEYLNWTIGNAQARIQKDVAEGYAAKFLWELLNGVYANKQMEGILTNTDVIAGATETAVASVFDYEDLVDLEASITTNNEQNLRYVMDRTTLASVRKLQDGAGNYIFTPGEKGKPATINGIPVIVTGKVTAHNGTDIASRQVMPVVADGAYPIMLADFSGYLFGDAKGMMVMFDDKTGASEATFFWNFHAWNTGKVALPEKFKLLKIKSA